MIQRRAPLRLCAVAAATAGTLAIVAPADAAQLTERADRPANAWTADLVTIDADDVNVSAAGGVLRVADPSTGPASRRGGPAEGTLLLATHPLAEPANRVTAQLDGAAAGGSVTVDVRGRNASGEWSEWLGAGEVFGTPVTEVQVRVTLLGAAARLRGLGLTADTVPQPALRAGVRSTGLTYRVFATREGLVGGTTANGHVIVSRDHFVALPSRRGLAPKNAGDYSVRVCTADGARCEYAPVWDVGPWNTTDDYWNPPDVRQSWADLPQGLPEAQAAYQDGYNGGRDQFGRRVANPAGIDLADGTFWDGLQLSTNAWVDVTYLWTAADGPRGVVGGGPLNLRSGPGTSYASVGFAAKYARVPIECWVTGETVTGTYGTTNRWDRLAPGHYISHAYVAASGAAAPPC